MNKLVDAARKLVDTRLIVTAPYRRWLIEQREQGYPKNLAQWVGKELAKNGRDRRFSFSASSGGGCLRAQELAFLGAPPTIEHLDPQLINLFNDGKFRHLRWQIALMSQGIMEAAEVPMEWKERRLKGSADGVLRVPDDHAVVNWRGKECGFELKGMSPFLFAQKKKLRDSGGANEEVLKHEHIQQVARYCLVKGWKLFCIVYEDKATQDWMEFVIEPTRRQLNDAAMELEDLNQAIDSKRLDKKLPECHRMKAGGAFYECSFGVSTDGACFDSGNWPSPSTLRRWAE